MFKTSAPTAILSPCGAYRYTLTRTWDQYLPRALLILYNPSTADSFKDDPTSRRCVGLVKTISSELFGRPFGSVEVVNLFAFRATKPKVLKQVVPEELVGPENDRYIAEAMRRAQLLIGAWGAFDAIPSMPSRIVRIRQLAQAAGKHLHAFEFTKEGQPRHPLMLKRDRQPVRM